MKKETQTFAVGWRFKNLLKRLVQRERKLGGGAKGVIKTERGPQKEKKNSPMKIVAFLLTWSSKESGKKGLFERGNKNKSHVETRKNGPRRAGSM